MVACGASSTPEPPVMVLTPFKVAVAREMTVELTNVVLPLTVLMVSP
jgi:hypothetical protein